MKTLNKAEYWLLDLVVRGSYPLHILAHPDLELIANRDHHRLSHLELLRTLVNLFEDGSLIGVRYPDAQTSIDFLPNYQEIDLALKGHDREMQYKLTTMGGSKWESLSNPNWDWCIGDNTGNSYYSSYNSASAETKFLYMAEHWIESRRYSLKEQPILSSKIYQVLQPWQVTYWKTLPEGHRIDCLMQDMEDSSINSQQDWPPDVRNFWEKSQNWYTNPFK